MNPDPNPSTLSLDELNLTPDWVKAPVKSFERHTGDEGERRPGRGPRPPRDRQGGPPRDRREGGGGPRRDFRGKGAGGARPDRYDRPGNSPQPSRPAPVAPPAPLKVEISFHPNAPTLAAIIETVKQSPRAFALFDLAKLVLNKPERHTVTLVRKDGPLFRSLLAEGVFLSQEEALRHTLRQAAEKIFSQTEKAIEPPKGNFQFINRCGLTGELLGPPNYHEYQGRLMKHYQQRVPHVSFEQFRSRIETSRDPEIIKAWVDSRSKQLEYTCLLDAEPKVFVERADLEKHIRATHLAALVAQAESVDLPGPASRQIENHRVLEALRQAWESERKFPLKLVNELRPQLLRAGLHFFKHKKGITYISRIKPARFDSISHLTEHVQKIITFLRANPESTRKQLAEHLAPVDETLLASDLHWLIQDGYVVEFYDGRLWALEEKKPAPPATQATAPATESPAAEATAPAAEQPLAEAPAVAPEPSPAAPVAEPVEPAPVGPAEVPPANPTP